jgi:hypothetical protein
MRCTACNKALTDIESTRKDGRTGEYYDLCGNCYQSYRDNLVTLEDYEYGTEAEIKEIVGI